MGKAEKRLEHFIRARIGEAPPGDPVARSHRALVAALDALRREASADEDWAWVEAVSGWFGDWFDDGGSPSGSDSGLWEESAEKTAAAVAARVLACMALVYADHPDYNPAWEKAAAVR